jgi:hypothetical protein
MFFILPNKEVALIDIVNKAVSIKQAVDAFLLHLTGSTIGGPGDPQQHFKKSLLERSWETQEPIPAQDLLKSKDEEVGR